MGEDELETVILRDGVLEGGPWEDGETEGGDGKVIKELCGSQNGGGSICFDELDSTVVRWSGRIW